MCFLDGTHHLSLYPLLPGVSCIGGATARISRPVSARVDYSAPPLTSVGNNRSQIALESILESLMSPIVLIPCHGSAQGLLVQWPKQLQLSAN